MESYLCFVGRMEILTMTTQVEFERFEDYSKKVEGVKYPEYQYIEYFSSTVGKKRRAKILLPAGYSSEKKYPILYLLHGIGGDEDEWSMGHPDVIIGNLVAQGRVKEMIVVMPNERAREEDQKCDDLCVEHFSAFNNFLNDLRDDLMPYMESHFSVLTERENTAIAGLSMGGRTTLYIGLSMPERFGYIGAFEPAVGVLPYEIEPQGLFTVDTLRLPEEYQNNTFMFLVKGTQDKVVGDWPRIYHETLAKNGTSHQYYEVEGNHDFGVWSDSLHNYVKQIFK